MDTTHSNSLRIVIVICSLMLFCNLVVAADIYVDVSNISTETGTIDHPYNTIQEAINAASVSSTITIAVAAGTYSENVLIDEHVIILQGGYSSDFTSRAPSTNITIIHGDGTDSVVTLNLAGASTIDGFTITGGSGSSEYLPDFYSGGGIFITDGAPVISNNIIENNDTTQSSAADARVESDGGGISTYYADTQILNNIIRNNTAGYGAGIKVNDGNVVIQGNTISSNVGINDHGGGIHASGQSLEITNNVIENNSIGEALGYGQGGGVIVYGDGTTATLSGNIVRGNTAPSFGAGEFVDDGAIATLENELVYNNTLTEEDGMGAGIYIDGWEDGGTSYISYPTIKNVTVADNNCGTSTLACGLAVDEYSQATVTNSIFWGHSGKDLYVNESSSTLSVSYTNSLQNYNGIGNIVTGPLFANAGSDDYHLNSMDGRWDSATDSWTTDSVSSPCIDAGTPSAAYGSEPSPNGGRVNMGAFGNTDEASKSQGGGEPGQLANLIDILIMLAGGTPVGSIDKSYDISGDDRIGLAEAIAILNDLSSINEWVSLGIGAGGALYHPAISPHNPDILYMATDMTGVYTSTNFGASWDVINFLQLTGGDLSNIRFTSSPQVLYAVNQDGTDYLIPSKSTDGGKTWSDLTVDPTSREAFSLYADPNSTQRLLVSDYDTVYFSSDGGQTFSTVRTSSDLYVAGAFWDENNIYIGTSDGLLISGNGGQNFTLSSMGGIPGDEKMSSFAGAKQGGTTRLFAVTLFEDDVWPGITGAELEGFMAVYTWDSGDTAWTETATSLGVNEMMFFVAMAPNNISTVYLGGGRVYDDPTVPLVYKSTNGGIDWSFVLSTNNNQNIVTGWCGHDGDLNWWYPEYILGLGVSPSDANRVIITDLGFVHVTKDGGTTWRQAYVKQQFENDAGSPTPKGRVYSGVGMENTSLWSLHWTGDGNKTIIASYTDIHGARSTDGGITWVAGSALGLDQYNTYMVVEHPTSGRLFAATSPEHDMYQSTYLKDVKIDNKGGHIKYSDDEGATWHLLHDFGDPVVWLALDPNNTNTLYASVVNSSSGGIYRTTNLNDGSSSTWSLLTKPPRTEGHPFNIRVLDDGSLVVSYSGRIIEVGPDDEDQFTESSGVFLSTNDGGSWVDRSDVNMRRWTKDIVVDPHDSTQNTWYATVFSHWGTAPIDVGGLYKTTDRGLNWTRLSSLNRVDSCTIHPSNREVMYLSTETQGLWRTNNLSADSPSFTQIKDYPYQHPVRMFFHPDNSNQLWVTGYGHGLMVKNISAP